MIGGYRKKAMPRVIHLAIARYRPDLPQPDEALDFIVSIHEEGTGITWQQNVTVDLATEKQLVDATHDLLLWSVNRGLTPKTADERVQEISEQFYNTFIGAEGEKILRTVKPTAILFDVDETILNLPWELIGAKAGTFFSIDNIPFGRLITTRTILRQGRDPLQEDSIVRILAVANPTSDIAASEAGIEALRQLEGFYGEFQLKVDVLTKEQATLNNFHKKLKDGDYDMLHFGGHGFMDRDTPGLSLLRFNDGDLFADQVLQLPWKKPPYFVFNSACESARAIRGQRLVSGKSQSNGLAAAFLAAGIQGYAGYFWPVTDVGAGIFTKTFYRTLFERENVGLAFMEARREVLSELADIGDLTGFSAVLFGDAASEHRQDLFLKK